MTGLVNRMRRGRRAQTTIDFAFGIGVFLLAVSFIFLFIPDLIAPFDTPGQGGDKIQAERTADHLVDDVLAAGHNTSQGNTLAPTCVNPFFHGSTTPPAHCGFDTTMYSNGRLNSSALGLDTSTHVNVSLQTLDGTQREAVGERVPPGRNVQEWSRLVSVAGEAHRLKVQVW